MAIPPELRSGWRVVAASFLVTFTIYGVSIFAFIVLIQSLAVQRGWTPAHTGGLVSAMWLAAPLALVAGPLAQRVNPWRLIAAGIALQALAIAGMLVVTEIWQIYLLRFGMGVGKVMAIAALPMLVSPWFTTRFATAMAIVWAGGSAGGLVLSPVMDALIVDHGWQRAALIVAAGTLGCLVVIQLLAWGLRAPDTGKTGGGLETGPETPSARAVIVALDLPVALIMFLAVTAAGVASISILSMAPNLLERAGFTSDKAATLLGLTALGAFIGSMSIGWLLDRFNAAVSSIVVIGSIALGVLVYALLLEAPDFRVAVAGALACGYAAGSGEVLWMNLTKRQFGEAAFPITYGGWFIALQLGYALGGSLSGWSLLRFGTVGFLVFVSSIYVLPAISSLMLRAGRLPPASRA